MPCNGWTERDLRGPTSADIAPAVSESHANRIYYFTIAQGRWEGTFHFAILDWLAFWRDPIGLKYRLFALLLHLAHRLFGATHIVSVIRPFPGEGVNGISRSRAWVTKGALTLYALSGDYVLDPDGVNVHIWIRERFGPVPFLFRELKHVSAAITHGGRRSRYHMTLLGARWTGDYEVAPDREHVAAVYRSPWGEAREVIAKAPDQ